MPFLNIWSFKTSPSFRLFYHGHYQPTSTLLPALPRSASSSSEPLEEQQVAQLLRRFSTDPNIRHSLFLDSTLAHHLHQCYYHLRLFRNWLISGQDPLEYLYG